MDFLVENERKLNKIYKILNKFGILFIAFGMFVSYIIGFYLMIFLLFLFLIIIILTLKKPSLGKYNTFVFSLIVVIGNLFNLNTNFELFYLPLIAVSILTYKKNILQTSTIIILYSCLFGVVLFKDFISLNLKALTDYQVIFSSEIANNLKFLNLITCLGILTVVLFFYRSVSNAYEKTIITQKNDIEKKNKAIQKQSNIILKQQKERHELEISQKQKDLDMVNANNNMKLVIKGKLINELQEIKKSDNINAALNKLIFNLKAQYETEKKVNLAHNNLDQVNTLFYERLLKAFPSLSKTERELCAYFKLGLSSKEVAELRNTSDNTINVAKTRLKKKLGLKNNSEIIPFLIKF